MTISAQRCCSEVRTCISIILSRQLTTHVDGAISMTGLLATVDDGRTFKEVRERLNHCLSAEQYQVRSI